MSDDKTPPARSAAEERAGRLAQALRDNLRRRKAQARAQNEQPRAEREPAAGEDQ
ncbi:hypothetical protein [Rhizorhabdus sp. FW153]|uniref:hypothetical protein n=1 Tax=Rhizorhabdus sp. FW153 TaxID=3400216 RepID=UPI003CF2E4EC